MLAQLAFQAFAMIEADGMNERHEKLRNECVLAALVLLVPIEEPIDTVGPLHSVMFQMSLKINVGGTH